jgi:hypothetical protein
LWEQAVEECDLDKNSHINIDRNNVLMNNSILSIGLDKENDL